MEYHVVPGEGHAYFIFVGGHTICVAAGFDVCRDELKGRASIKFAAWMRNMAG